LGFSDAQRVALPAVELFQRQVFHDAWIYSPVPGEVEDALFELAGAAPPKKPQISVWINRKSSGSSWSTEDIGILQRRTMYFAPMSGSRRMSASPVRSAER
jgi:hypothetical protein